MFEVCLQFKQFLLGETKKRPPRKGLFFVVYCRTFSGTNAGLAETLSINLLRVVFLPALFRLQEPKECRLERG